MKRLVTAVAVIAGTVPATLAQQPIITDVHWPYINSYCAFQRAGQSFDYNDLDTWRYVFFDSLDTITPFMDGFDTDIESPPSYAYIGLHHQVRQLEELSREETGTGETRSYRTWGEPSYMVEVTMLAGEGGGESTAYTGTISVSGPGGEEKIEFHGDCGV